MSESDCRWWHWLGLSLIVLFCLGGCRTAPDEVEDSGQDDVAESLPEQEVGEGWSAELGALIPEETLLLVAFEMSGMEKLELFGVGAGPFQHLMTLEGLDRERHHFLINSAMGYEEILEEMRLGMPVARADFLPGGLHERVILAVDDREVLQESMERMCEREWEVVCKEVMKISVQGDFVVVDWVLGGDPVPVEAWGEGFDAIRAGEVANRGVERTAAWTTFESLEGEIRVYGRVSDFFSLWAILDLLELEGTTSDEDVSEWMQGATEVTLDLMVDSPDMAEIYDVAANMVFRDDRYAVDMTGSLTPLAMARDERRRGEAVEFSSRRLRSPWLTVSWAFDAMKALETTRRPNAFVIEAHDQFHTLGWIQYPRASMAMLLARWEDVLEGELDGWEGLHLELGMGRRGGPMELSGAVAGKHGEALMRVTDAFRRLGLMRLVGPLERSRIHDDAMNEVHIFSNRARSIEPVRADGLEVIMETAAPGELSQGGFGPLYEEMLKFPYVVWRSKTYDDQWRGRIELGAERELAVPEPVVPGHVPSVEVPDKCYGQAAVSSMEALLALDDIGTIFQGENIDGLTRGLEAAREGCARMAASNRLKELLVSWKALDDDRVEGDSEIERSEIQDVIRRRQNFFTHCYERELEEKPELEGQVVMSFLIGPEGEVLEATSVESTLESPEVEVCIIRVLERLRFPEPSDGESVRVNYPFNFTPGR